MRRLLSLLPAVALIAAAVAFAPAPTQAATPASGALSFANPKVTWTNSAPMNGSAPAFTRISCNAPTTCDDFALHVDRGGADTSYMTLKLTPTGPVAGEEIIVYKPGCAVDPAAANPCYAVYG